MEENNEIRDAFVNDIEDMGKGLDSLVNHLNIVIDTHNKQVEIIHDLKEKIDKILELCEKQFIDFQVDYLGNKTKRYAPIDTNKVIEILKGEDK